MQHSSIFIITVALVAHVSHGLSIEGKGKEVTAGRLKLKASVMAADSSPISHTALAQELVKDVAFSNVDPVLVRPNQDKGVDTVNVGLMIMNFFGTNLKEHTFSIDMVMSARWKDERAIALIPEGLDELSMAWSQALKLLWMPGIVVTNRDIEKYEIVSASVTIYRTGEVLRVERAQARIMMKFQLEAYPFDTQHLAVKVASSKYMLDEVVLTSDKNASGVDENIWGLYDMDKWDTKIYESRDGFLQKSRATLDVKVTRHISKYYEDHLVPSFIALTISWAVFYFPFANPFITPRLVLSILALLTFTNLMVKSSKELPGAAPFNWNDLFNQQIQALMFITIILNIFSEIAVHQFHNERLARKMNNDAKVLIPALSILNILVILSAGRYDWMELARATTITKSTLAILILGYVGSIVFGEHKINKNQAKEDEGEPMGLAASLRA